MKVTTSCAPDAVDKAERVLRLRGIRVDRTDRYFTNGIDSVHPTLNNFWTSPLGYILKGFAKEGPQTRLSRHSGSLFHGMQV